MKLADVEKAQETARNLAAAAEAARTQHEAALNSQEEDLAAREAKLAAMLRGKDAEVEKLVLQRTSELEKSTKRHSMPRPRFTPARWRSWRRSATG